MAEINERASENNDQPQYQNKVEFDGVDSDVIILPTQGSHTFNFVTAGSGTIQVTMSSRRDILDGNALWVDNDLDGGPAFSSPGKIGAFRADIISSPTFKSLGAKI